LSTAGVGMFVYVFIEALVSSRGRLVRDRRRILLKAGDDQILGVSFHRYSNSAVGIEI
jgi:hypothetical protein